MLEIRKALSDMLEWGVNNYDNLNTLTINIDMMDNDGYTRRAILKLGDWVMKVSGNLLMKTIGERVFDQEEFYANVTAPCRIYKEGKDGLLEAIFPWFDENVDTWGAKPLISYDPKTKQWSTHPNDNDVLPENRYNVRLVQATLADVVGSISGELAKQYISECNKEEVVEQPVDTQRPADNPYIEYVSKLLTEVYEDDDDTFSHYEFTTDEFQGCGSAWLGWICRSVLTIEGDDHLCEKVVARLSAPMKIRALESHDDNQYWPGILCGEDPEPLVFVGEHECVMNTHVNRVDLRRKQAICHMADYVCKLINKINEYNPQ